jgi:uncharacterized protein YhjY with autotransporter beta-barrel domain
MKQFANQGCVSLYSYVFRHENGRRAFLVLFKASVVLALGHGASVHANDFCPGFPFGPTITCSGNQSAGVGATGLWYHDGGVAIPFGVSTLTLTNLTASIVPVAGRSGASLDSGRLAGDSGGAFGDGDIGSFMFFPLKLTYDGSGRSISTSGTLAHGISVIGSGGDGGNGGDSAIVFNAGDAGSGGFGAPVQLTSTGNITTTGNGANGIRAVSGGGQGGIGGDTLGAAAAGNGGNGGGGGSVSLTASGNITTTGAWSSGILVATWGGNAGYGGDITGAGWAGDGGTGGYGGFVLVDFKNGTIATSNYQSEGIRALSRGGSGGAAGSCSGICVEQGVAGVSQAGGNIQIDAGSGTLISTNGALSHGIVAQSIGGIGGGGGSVNQFGVFGYGGQGGGGADGGNVTIDAKGRIITSQNVSHGIYAQSVGGGGGDGGDSGGLGFALGGQGGIAGSGGVIEVTNAGQIETSGLYSRGIQAQSVGGGGGDGGYSIGLLSIGGKGGAAGAGGAVTVTNSGSIDTHEIGANAIFAQSVGGGGGVGGFSLGVIAIGGNGGGGGVAGDVTVNNTSTRLATVERDAAAIFAQSVGGGGGHGGGALGIGFSPFPLTFSLAIGGKGERGNNGQTVTVEGGSGEIVTQGERSAGIFAQSVGGGGGDGGFAISTAGGPIASIGISIGGDGFQAGNGGTVDVASASRIKTGGDDAAGILASSIGGGGGDAGLSLAATLSTIGFDIAVGGFGAIGGDSGQVNVGQSSEAISGNIETSGARSSGIKAVSLAGSGGSAGLSIAANIGASSFGLSLGKGGGNGGIGGEVNVFSVANISTQREDSYGIFAESLGGGGGTAGFSLAAGIAIVPTMNISIGGPGGYGGVGGAVNVGTLGTPIAGTITTAGERASGIKAVSTGGQGGSGGGSVTGGVSIAAGGIGFSIGGTGGVGAVSDAVKVISKANITTSNLDAQGIFAQSLAGNGGDGGFSVAGGMSLSGNLNLSIGSGGGAAGRAGEVTVGNVGNIVTSGANAKGIQAESIGGSGGNGGVTVAGGISFDDGAGNINVSIGRGGGIGGIGGTVNIINLGSINTGGGDASGVFAQSIGGNGGNGGFSGAGALSLGTGLNMSFSLGGLGGGGNVGGIVNASNYDHIKTTGSNAHGIYAESLGGGGGSGGNSLVALIGLSGASKGATVNLGASIGGKGGSGNTGGTVTVNNFSAGLIETEGYGANGIYAQSIGGGGGDGGKANSLSLILDKECSALILCKSNANAANNVSLTVDVGGNGGGASNGGQVTVNNYGDIRTTGAGANGIIAQSIGGGGGNGGNGSNGLGVPVLDALLLPDSLAYSQLGYLKELSVNVGGSGGASGNGGNVNVNNSGSISTRGDAYVFRDGLLFPVDAEGGYGIVAQSVGGGGGIALVGALFNGRSTSTGAGGDANVGLTGKLGIGGAAGSAGDGGTVIVTNSGVVTTTGSGAHAILAQSVGGGGGIAGDVNRLVLSTEVNVGLNLGFARESGNGGNGGDVDVISTASIVAAGANAFGIMAQSVGGGGGIAGNPGLLGFQVGSMIGSTGGMGSSGIVTVQQTGNISTRLQGSHGIVAQSVSGTAGALAHQEWDALGGFARSVLTNYLGKSGAVNVTLNGSVVTDGRDSVGILAQSLGTTSSGDITINIVSGGVRGGSGDGAGVKFMDGNNNFLDNRGTIGALSGMAILGGAGNEQVLSRGIVFGSVDLGSGANNFTNALGAQFLPGAQVFVGSGNELRNNGTLSPGGAGLVQHTMITGNLLQTQQGIYLADLDQQALSGDHLDASGTATLNGAANVVLLNAMPVQPGDHSIAIVSAAGGVSGTFDQVSLPSPTSLISYRLDYAANAASVVVTAKSYGAFASQGVGLATASYLNSVAPALMSNDLINVVIDIQSLQTPQAINSALGSLSPETYGGSTRASAATLSAQNGQLFSRLGSLRNNQRATNRQASGFAPFKLAYGGSDLQLAGLFDGDHEPRRTEGLWLETFSKIGDLEQSANGYSGFGYQANGITVGYDHAFGENWIAGAAYGYSRTDLKFSGALAQADIGGQNLSLYAGWQDDGVYLQGILSGGRNDYDQQRLVSAGSITRLAVSEHQGKTLGVSLAGGFMAGAGNWSRGPYAVLHYVRTGEDAFLERGAGGINLVMNARKFDALNTEFGMRAQHSAEFYDGVLIAELSGGWTHDFAIDDGVITAAYAGAPGTSFALQGQSIEHNGANFSAGLSYVDKNGLTAAVRYQGEVRASYQTHAVFGELRFSF